MRIDRFLYYALLLFIPLQLNKYYFPQSFLITGRRIDYLSINIYATEILLFLLILFWIKRRGIRKIAINILNIIKPRKFLVILLILILISIANSNYPLSGLLKLIKFGQLLLFGLYIYLEKPSLTKSIKILIISGIITSIIALVQFYLKHSIGGIFYFLGERAFTISTPGISKSVINGVLILRPYATFPHPNVLGAFISLLIPFVFIKLFNKKNTTFWLSVYFLFLITLIVSMSRSALISSFLSVIALSVIFYKKYHKNIKLLVIPPLIFSSLLLIPLSFYRFTSFFNTTDITFKERALLNNQSFEMIKNSPFLGVGLNNFLFHLPSQLLIQPVHNTFLLTFVENGIAGFLLLIYILYFTFKKIFKQQFLLKALFVVLFFQIVFFLSVDHYFYTLWQPQLLFTVFITFMITKDISYEK